MSDDPKPLSQEEIDSMFAGLSEDDASAADNESVEEDVSEGPLGQGDIDSLVAAMGAGDEEPAPEPEESAPEPESEGPLGQGDIDSLVAAMGGGDDSAEEPASEPEVPDGPLGQDDIDSLLASMGTETDPEPVVDPAPEADGPLGQDDIDSLLASMGAETDPEPIADPDATLVADPPNDDASSLDQEGIDALIAGMGTEDPEPVSEEDADPLGQEDIDDLIASMIEAGNEEQDPGSRVHKTGKLSTEQIRDIVSKQEETGETDKDGGVESMISQGDIDALMQQMSEASSVGETDEIDALLKEKNTQIDDLLNQAVQGEAGDAVEASMLTMAESMPQMSQQMVAAGSVMAPEELRGTRYMLWAALLLLSLCTATMVIVASSINKLTGELNQHRVEDNKPQEDFDSDIEYSMKLLESESEDDTLKGMRYFERLKSSYKDNPDKMERIHRILATYYRKHNAWEKARQELSGIYDPRGKMLDDPSFYVDYGDTLYRLDRMRDAEVIIYKLLANESYYTAVVDGQGATRKKEALQTNGLTIKRAYLLLGRMYNDRLHIPEDEGTKQASTETKSVGGAA